MTVQRRYWTVPQIAMFRQLYPITPIADLMREFGRSRSAIKNMAIGQRLHKDPSAMVRFPKGNVPWNVGKRYNAGGRSLETRFKKGQRGPRQKRVGAQRVSRDGIEIKIAQPNRWTSKARYLWERANGPIPLGMIIRNSGKGVRLENLRLISRSENIRLNRANRKPHRKVAPWVRQLAMLAGVA